MAKQTRREIYITCNGKSADDMIKTLTNHLSQMDAQIKKLIADGKGETKECKELVSVRRQLSKQLKANLSDTQLIDKVTKNLANSSTKQLRSALAAVRREMERTSEASGKLPQLRKQFEQLKTQIDKNTGAINRQSGAWKTSLKNLVAYTVQFSVFGAIKSKLTDVLKLNFQYSDSLANVRKVSNLSMESVNELSKMLAKVDSRTSLEGLTQLAYVGSRMGMGKYGVEGLAEFAKASDRVNVALKEDLGDDAMLTLSKFVETMGEVEKHGGNISNAFDAVSSSIFKLASTSTANGNNILEFAKRLTGLSKVSHITSDQLLGLASASDSLMLMPEVASTAFSKLINSLWNNYHDIENMLGMQKDSLKDMMSKGETMQALVTVLENVSSKNLNTMDDYFKEFGSDGTRLKNVVVTMAQNVDVLKEHLDESSRAYKGATAVTKEYEIQQQTAQAILERANNMWEKAFVNPDGINSVKELAKAWYDFSKTVTQSQAFLGSVRLFMWELKVAMEALMFVLPGLVMYLGQRGLVWAFSKLIPLMVGLSSSGIVRFFSLLTSAIMGSHMAMGRLIISWRTLNLTMKTNIIGLVLSLVASLGTWIYSLVKKTDDAAASMEKFNGSLDNVYRKANRSVGELDAYYRAILRAKKGSLEYQAAMKVYNDKFGVYFKNLKKENGMVQDLKESYLQAARAIRAKIYLQMKEEDTDKFVKPKVGRSLDRLAEYGQIAPAGFGQEMLEAYTRSSYGKDMSVIERELTQRLGVKNNKLVLQAIDKGRANLDNVLVPVTRNYLRGLVKDETFEVAKFSKEEQRLFRALRYVHQERAANNAQLGVERKFKPVQKQMDNYLLSSESNENLDDGGKKSSGGKAGRSTSGGRGDSEDKKEEQQAKTRANALVANVKAFYEEQQRKYLEWVTQMNADGEKVSEGQQKQMLDYLETRMNTALGAARQSIATLGDGWRKFYEHMDEDVVVFDDKTSKSLLESIGKSDVKELHALFEKMSGDLSRENNKTLAENLGALLDQIFANGSKDLRQAAEKLLAQQREIQKILNENDYTGAVNRDTRSNFDTLGFLKPAKGVAADSSKGLETMSRAFDRLTSKARAAVAELYRLSPESETFRESFLEYLSVANDGFDFSALNVQKLKALYIELIKYTDSYTEAEKREYDAAKKVINQMWSTNKRNLDNQAKLRKMQNESNLFGKRTNLLSNLGLADLTADPEVLLMKARMQAAEDYYAFVRKNSQNQQLIDEVERARQEAELNYANQMATSMKSRLSQMKELVQPIEDFGSAVGNALAEMKNDAESANEAIKNALKSMLQSWGQMALNDINTQMWKAINDAGAKRGRDKARPDIAAARANANANAVDLSGIDWRNMGTEANPLWVRWKDDHYEDKTGNAVYTREDGTPLPNPGGAAAQNQTSEPPRSWQKRNPGKTIDDYNREVQGVAKQTGEAVAGVATGNSSLSEAGAGVVMSGANALLNANLGGKSSNKEAKEKSKQLKDEKKHQKDLTKEVRKGSKDREKENEKGVKNITAASEEANKEQTQGEQVKQNTIGAITDTAMTMNLKAKQDNDTAVVEQSKDTARAENTFSIVGAIGKCFEFLGPIAGPIAAASVMAILTGLMNWGLNAAFGSKKKSTSSGSNKKLVSGMLTYDDGNVQDLKPFVANNGEVYWATEQSDVPKSGVSLLNTPTATTINGQRSLVAEQGPEIVIGRETTHAMMMNNPSLLKALVNYDRNHSGRNAARRAFDEGNVSEAVGNLASGASAADGGAAVQSATEVALLQAVNALLQRLSEPISAKIDMYGRGNLYDSMTKASQFMKGKS